MVTSIAVSVAKLLQMAASRLMLSVSCASTAEAARLLTWQAAWLIDQGQRATLYSSFAKRFSADTAMKVTTDAVQIFGGYGYMRDYPIEKYMRDAKITQIYEGTNQVQRIVIARELLRQPMVPA